MSLLEDFNRIESPRILVLGDLMLDRYTRGTTRRTSQEAPVLVLTAESHDHRPGGAANVGLMLHVLDARVTCAGVVGDDSAGRSLKTLSKDAGIQTESILTADDRPTTVKERFIGRAGSGVPSQILRVDSESNRPIDSPLESLLCADLENQIPCQDAVLISDYDKGVCTPRVISTAIRIANQHQIPILVDPGRGRDFNLYQKATLIKPNRTETEAFKGTAIKTHDDAIKAGTDMCHGLDLEMAVITLDVDGISLVLHNGQGHGFPTRARTVYDITGAGDMVLAVLGLAMAADTRPDSAVSLANIAAGLEVDRTGVAPLTRDEIRAELQYDQLDSRRKVCDVEHLSRICQEYRLRGTRVALTNGCFDLLHVGHASYLEEAASMADVLIVALNSDASVKRLKGADRPVIGERERAAMLASLGCVDHVVVFDDDTPHQVIRTIRPDILVKGGTYARNEVVGHELVEAYGGQVRVTGSIEGVSTTKILNRVKQRVPLRRAG